MHALNLKDLNCSAALDYQAMSELIGGTVIRELRHSTLTNGPSTMVQVSSQLLGVAFHDGALSRHYRETFKRTWVQTTTLYYDAYYSV